MRKYPFLFLACFLIILSALFLIFQLPGSAKSLTADNTVQDVYLPVVTNAYIYEEPQGESIIEGVLTNARTDQPIDGVDICLSGDPLCAESNITGVYVLGEVPAGDYTLTASHPNYENFSDQLHIVAGTTVNFDIQLLPRLEDDQYRVVLTWDPTPSWQDGIPNNLDLHLWLRDSGDYHIYEGNLGGCSNLNQFPYACYERDEQYGSGPDAIVFTDAGDKYTIAVLNYYDEYPGVPLITDLDVRVEVHDAKGLLGNWDVNYAQGESGDLWYVFDLDLGEFYPQNCLLQYDNQNETPPADCALK